MKYFVICVLLLACNSGEGDEAAVLYDDEHRPQIHFSPQANWMNDPNGLIYHNGTYHMFFQYYPDSTVWGPMHWGHATSKDLLHWTEEAIALYPDDHGYIFSGSAVFDKNNTSGFGKNGTAPLVAIFTYFDAIAAKNGKDINQTQGLAYSLDSGVTWKKYENNPVLFNYDMKDFRDPKVFWYEPQNKWIMTLATGDRISFYSSPNLKEWKKESEFGSDKGAHGGVWECPDLFRMSHEGDSLWVLLVSINPGGPNGGSATQYFIGQFDGSSFTSTQTDTKWIDYGPDNYAGVTWSNVGERKLFIGWMSNWLYGQKVPTQKWRSAMTVPRDLQIEKVNNEYYLASRPIPELISLNDKEPVVKGDGGAGSQLGGSDAKYNQPGRLTLETDRVQSFTIEFSNGDGEKLLIGFDEKANEYYIDRRAAGKKDFEKGFAEKHSAPRISTNKTIDLELIIDEASVELFADGGLSVMTSVFFPNKSYTNFKTQIENPARFNKMEFRGMKSIWSEKK